MPDRNDKAARNAAGPYYVDSSCVDCDICRNAAPAFFRRDDDAGVSYVYRQPSSPDEVAEAEEGLNACPTESIGRDGLECQP